MKRREFLLQASLVIGGTVVWRHGGNGALAQVPWEDERDSLPLGEETDPAIDWSRPLGTGRRDHSPRVALGPGGEVHLAWVAQEDGAERVYLTRWTGNGFAEPVAASEPGRLCGEPALATANGEPVVVYTERSGNAWHVVAGRLAEGSLQWTELARVPVLEGSAWAPAIAVNGQGVWVAWEEIRGETGRIMVTRLSGGKALPAFAASPSTAREPRRPSLAPAMNGGVWVAWDEATHSGGRSVFLRRIDADTGTDEPIRITHHPAASIAPALATDTRGRVWVAFTSNRLGEDKWDIPRWIYTRCWDGRELLEPAGPPVMRNLAKEGTDQSFEMPRVLCAPDGKVVVSGRPSHNFCLQWYHGDGWSPLYRLPRDGWGGRGRILDMALDGDGALWVVRRDLNVNVLERLPGFVGNTREPALKPCTEAANAAPALLNIVRAPRRWPAIEAAEGIDAPLNAYFGDLHGHTYMSDGVGDIDEYFYTRRDYYEDDFASLTDHDYFVGLPLTLLGWEKQKALTDLYNREGSFVTLFGQEWTTARYPRGGGHKCIYSTNPAIPLFDHTRGYGTTEQLYAALREWPALVFPHHTGWTGTDWEQADPAIQTLAEIVSNHGCFEYQGNTPIAHRGGAQGCFLQDGLARGLRFGFIGGSDSHGLLWHHHAGWKRDCNRTGLAAVLAPELTRDAVFEALRRRRTYATTGNKPRLDFRVNNHLMGDEFVYTDGPLEIRAEIAAREDIRWIHVVRNNETWYTYGGEGYTSRWSVTDDDPPGGTAWYYLRVVFETGDMAWSSPVWATRAG